ncbi:YceI family protein [Massilia sp. W12]|uniref:YceI family protein n=1 Tax=Massilia sp. W12 TaxID=3126507 RepID=UPI0030CE3568
MLYSKLILLLLLLFSCLPLLAASWLVDHNNSSAWFAVGYLGNGQVKGRLAVQAGRVEFDRQAQLAQGEIGFDMNSVQTGRSNLDHFIKSASIFDSANYPDMRFRAMRLEFDGLRLQAAHGELQLRGVTRPVRLEVKRLSCADQLPHLFESGRNLDDNLERAYCQAEFVTSISRSQFGMDAYSLLVKDEVDIAAQLVLQRMAP